MNEKRFLVITAYGGIITDVRPFEDIVEAVNHAERAWKKANAERDDIKIFDLTGNIHWTPDY